jgi:hypothetical protein
MKTLFMMLMIIVLVLVPVMAVAENYSAGGQAPIAQPLVREGTVAVKMVEVLNLGTTTSEVEAENLLVGAGIAPRNGWISDYPVTPDIANELRTAVNGAAGAGSITVGRDEAVLAFDGVLSGYNLVLGGDTPGEAVEQEQSAVYPDNAEINDYYYNDGPPAVTYYAPPADYAYMYSWVPYPFWGWNSRYPGFFVLGDFDRFAFADRHAFAVSNHFFDEHEQRFGRIDAAARFREFHGRRFDDQGRYFVNTRVVGPSDVRREAERSFVGEHNRARFDVDRSRSNFNSSREMGIGSRELNRENRTSVSSTGRMFNFSGRREGTIVAPSERGGNFSRPAERAFRPFSDRGGHREFNSAPRTLNSGHVYAPSGRGRTSAPAVSNRGSSPSFGGMRGGSMGGFSGGRRGR